MKPYTTLCVVSMVTSSSILKNIPCMTNVSKMKIHQCSLSVLVIKVGVDVILDGYVGKHYIFFRDSGDLFFEKYAYIFSRRSFEMTCHFGTLSMWCIIIARKLSGR